MRVVVVMTLLAVASTAQARELRVCADPNNPPFSKQDGTGFENRIVELIARDLGAQVHYTWWAQRRGNLRNTLNAGDCDVVPGIASGLESVATTRPYYRSSYVFVARAGSPWASVSSLDDARLHSATIGVQLVGDDGANTPPAQALSRRGMLSNIRGYTVYGDYLDTEPQRPIIDAVGRGEVDVALVWGPTAGFFARNAQPALRVTPATPWLDGPQAPMVFDISMGVRRDDRPLRRELDAALERNAAAIQHILADYGVPQLPLDADLATDPVTSSSAPTGGDPVPAEGAKQPR